MITFYKIFLCLFFALVLHLNAFSKEDKYLPEELGWRTEMIRDAAKDIILKTEQNGLLSPFMYNTCYQSWPSRFVQHWENYSQFRSGFHHLFWWADVFFTENIFDHEKNIKKFEKKIKGLKNLDELTLYSQLIAKEQSSVSRNFEKKAIVESILTTGWSEIQRQFEKLFDDHSYIHHPSFFFNRGMFNYDKGLYGKCIEDIQHLVETGKVTEILKYETENEAELMLDVARGFIEVCSYQQAVEILNQIIEKDPTNKDAIFERATAYFELGEFDRSLKDFLHQRSISIDKAALSPNWIEFSEGMLVGIKSGICCGAEEFFPTLLNSLHGIGNLIWATIEHPIQMPQQFALATMEFIEFLKETPKEELAAIVVPELYKLVTEWDDLFFRDKGHLAGYIFGKYGMDICLTTVCFKGAQGVKKIQQLKKAEKLCALETLAATQEQKEALIQSAKLWNENRNVWCARVELEADKQGKHLRGHRNFNESRSEWIHPDPEANIRKFGGKGQKISVGSELGIFKERVDCGEVIGFYFDKETNERIPTTMAIIHYSKKGAHIVPARPK
ncbi:MAG: hypothetical protein JSR39_06980 [Verrucomicrobia bacterium]|nr:hypothetical protein [Verrucomicrobiota bacterium]